MGQGDSARDFDTSESMKNAGILDVFPIFHTARLGQKIRRSLQLPLCGVALRQHRIMGQGDSARDFGPAESSENAGILCVFPVFRTVRMGQKTRRSPRLPPKRCCLKDTSSVKRPASGAIWGGSHASLPDEISPPGRLGSNFALAFLIGLCYSIEEIIPAGVMKW